MYSAKNLKNKQKLINTFSYQCFKMFCFYKRFLAKSMQHNFTLTKNLLRKIVSNVTFSFSP